MLSVTKKAADAKWEKSIAGIEIIEDSAAMQASHGWKK
ncbi:hypothetical protein PRUB_a4317 [Pseudoalteromonas rubra]|uniref:Uncharacterized protein n=1 Tax=Pseudoalteromonas rubra TaxID=43658 RepID=A0A8T0C5A1_9GAMM|nr:hypothetical protein PRUB_a4317 [Pseudoalteromonas rubra]